jgi:hypothetical protein
MAAKAKEEVEFVDDIPQDGRKRYEELLAQVKGASTGPKAGKWAKLADFDNLPSGRDASGRLRRTHADFDFTTRTSHDSNGIAYLTIYCRYTGKS